MAVTDVVVRPTAIYLVLLAFLRLSRKRSMAQLTTFDFVLLLIVSEAAQQVILGENFSIVGRVSGDLDADHAQPCLGHAFGAPTGLTAFSTTAR